MERQNFILGNRKYIYKSDNDKDYLIGSNSGIKISISFTKNPNKNNKAKEALKAFFTELYT